MMLAVAYHKEPHATQRWVARATVVRVAWRDGDEFVLGLGGLLRPSWYLPEMRVRCMLHGDGSGECIGGGGGVALMGLMCVF